MSIDEQANSDLTLNEQDAEAVVGGKAKKTVGKAAPTHQAAPTFHVEVIDHAGGTNPTPVDTESMEAAQDC